MDIDIVTWISYSDTRTKTDGRFDNSKNSVPSTRTGVVDRVTDFVSTTRPLKLDLISIGKDCYLRVFGRLILCKYFTGFIIFLYK